MNGNMVMGLFGEQGAGPFGPAERPMGGYVTLPAAWHAAPANAELWIAKALDHVGSLPAKVK